MVIINLSIVKSSQLIASFLALIIKYNFDLEPFGYI